tara:strand:+ start:2068 stop:2682 length:615 start_codon:yes stop_codon:yes gene_type:complete
MPFAGYENFRACVADQKSKGKSEDAANAICGSLQAQYKEKAAQGFEVMKSAIDSSSLPNSTANREQGSVSKAPGGASTPAPKKDQVRGSKRNKPGSAKNQSGGVSVSAATEKTLRNKVKTHNESMKKAGKPSWSRATLGKLKAVYRRGSGAFSTSHRPGMARGQWANARVNAFLHLLRTGSPKNSKYTTDNDLLPAGHPKKSKK